MKTPKKPSLNSSKKPAAGKGKIEKTSKKPLMRSFDEDEDDDEFDLPLEDIDDLDFDDLDEDDRY